MIIIWQYRDDYKTFSPNLMRFFMRKFLRFSIENFSKFRLKIFFDKAKYGLGTNLNSFSFWTNPSYLDKKYPTFFVYSKTLNSGISYKRGYSFYG